MNGCVRGNWTVAEKRVSHAEIAMYHHDKRRALEWEEYKRIYKPKNYK